ncbi:hypothetical protein GLOIN_2v1868257 [Rhizophagus irregularis DAOM 181602=DAOM 197198]|uniref:Uncharacterized protein n=1 Tax=Rhizophagus irregularis (strain DAOM 181602 / DAOM 197198 / MUCL 43194) TaxID=747089 RepID=A0A2P4QV00_RHIID|nr:hypothetical protein GLOIN_2v1868257 [Rhizophagus irregularis DAOM 181602=DAOM 197198]POG81469.1 hypothetical protein GLOIN_2v1868257 [Rhizophagus irregularis DAOM 181602=DAOM 197198]|eukprot:XP_025188335.1 hypothetical protein GLOIN_2v1868257 [Rhizophagus irregularis DAOM 181602=DAOM 197198]
MKIILKFLLPYMHSCSLQIKLDIWKVRNNIWKTIRSDWGLTKKHFIKYRETFLTELRTLAAVRRTDPPIPNDRERGYINPFNDFRNFKLDKDFLFILFSSSNFLHSDTHVYSLCCSFFLSYCNAPMLVVAQESSGYQEVRGLQLQDCFMNRRALAPKLLW